MIKSKIGKIPGKIELKFMPKLKIYLFLDISDLVFEYKIKNSWPL